MSPKSKVILYHHKPDPFWIWECLKYSETENSLGRGGANIAASFLSPLQKHGGKGEG